MSTGQLIAFCLPDVVTFLNNTFFILLCTAVPERKTLSGADDISHTALMVNLLNVFSLTSSITLSVISGRVRSIFWLMVSGNLCFYLGATLMYTSTMTGASFPGSFEIGTVFAGWGDASIVNLCIAYKFELHRRWGIQSTDLGAMSAMIYSFVMSISTAIGSAVSGATVPTSAEQGTLIVTVASWVLTTVCLVIPRLVK